MDISWRIDYLPAAFPSTFSPARISQTNRTRCSLNSSSVSSSNISAVISWCQILIPWVWQRVNCSEYAGERWEKWFNVSILSIHYFLTENFFRRNSVYSSVTMFKCVVRTGEATSFEYKLTRKVVIVFLWYFFQKFLRILNIARGQISALVYEP